MQSSHILRNANILVLIKTTFSFSRFKPQFNTNHDIHLSSCHVMYLNLNLSYSPFLYADTRLVLVNRSLKSKTWHLPRIGHEICRKHCL
jgi:hypothetical protein